MLINDVFLAYYLFYPKLECTCYHIDSVDGHGEDADDEVRHGEREEVVVGDGLQLLVHLKADHDHEVASDGDEAEEASGYADQGGLKRRVRDDDGVRWNIGWTSEPRTPCASRGSRRID